MVVCKKMLWRDRYHLVFSVAGEVYRASSHHSTVHRRSRAAPKKANLHYD